MQFLLLIANRAKTNFSAKPNSLNIELARGDNSNTLQAGQMASLIATDTGDMKCCL